MTGFGSSLPLGLEPHSERTPYLFRDPALRGGDQVNHAGFSVAISEAVSLGYELMEETKACSPGRKPASAKMKRNLTASNEGAGIEQTRPAQSQAIPHDKVAQGRAVAG